MHDIKETTRNFGRLLDSCGEVGGPPSQMPIWSAHAIDAVGGGAPQSSQLSERLHTPRIRVLPRRPIRSREQPIGFIITNDTLLRRIPLQAPAQFLRHVREYARRR